MDIGACGDVLGGSGGGGGIKVEGGLKGISFLQKKNKLGFIPKIKIPVTSTV